MNDETNERLDQQDAMIELLLEWVGYIANLTPDEIFDGVEKFHREKDAMARILNND